MEVLKKIQEKFKHKKLPTGQLFTLFNTFPGFPVSGIYACASTLGRTETYDLLLAFFWKVTIPSIRANSV